MVDAENKVKNRRLQEAVARASGINAKKRRRATARACRNAEAVERSRGSGGVGEESVVGNRERSTARACRTAETVERGGGVAGPRVGKPAKRQRLGTGSEGGVARPRKRRRQPTVLPTKLLRGRRAAAETTEDGGPDYSVGTTLHESGHGGGDAGAAQEWTGGADRAVRVCDGGPWGGRGLRPLTQ